MFTSSSDLLIPLSKKRASLRRKVQTDCHVVAERGFTLLAERTLNLSPFGALIPIDKTVYLDDEVILSLRLPGGSTWVDAMGRVTRILFRENACKAAAVSFDEMSNFDRAILRGALFGKPPLGEAVKPRFDYAAHVSQIAA